MPDRESDLHDPHLRAALPEEITSHFRSRDKHVITFAGFGELGYRDPAAVEAIVDEVLSERPPNSILVNCGTLLRVDGNPGIADVYRVARERGIETAGIHPGIALDHLETHRLSPFVDHSFFVEDTTWGGLHRDGSPTPTLRTILEVTDELAMIGGGRHAAGELRAFLDASKPVRYFPAEMDPVFTLRWIARSGADIEDHRGEAYRVWVDREGASRLDSRSG